MLTTDGHAGKAYELGGDEAFTLAELAAEISAGSGTPVRYTDLPEADYVQALAGNGVPRRPSPRSSRTPTRVCGAATFTSAAATCDSSLGRRHDLAA